ncbi:MAG: hypothetical protein FJ222_05295 [Lentisphaerae bacterium]|nr:hypothetical protein [Lentisphaerota bacterium]
MKKLMLFAVVAMIGASASLATDRGGWPRVYQYSASLNTAVAKNAAKVKYVGDCEGTDEDVCYRVKGKVSLKGVVVFGCECVDEGALDRLDDCYPLLLVGTSADKYSQIVFAEGDVMLANRLGAPQSSKAKVAELLFGLGFRTGADDDCGRWFALGHAGFGTAASTVASGEGMDIVSIAGSVVGYASAPVCSAEAGNCPRCDEGGKDCARAIAFDPCTMDDCDEGHLNGGVAYGTFSLKYNKTLATAIKDIDECDVQDTVEALVDKVFGTKADAPEVSEDCACEDDDQEDDDQD